MSTLTEAALAPQQRDHDEPTDNNNNNNANENNNDNEDRAKDSSHHHHPIGTQSGNGQQEQFADDATNKLIKNKVQTTNQIVIDRVQRSDSADADDSDDEQSAISSLAHQRATTATECSATNDNSSDSNDSSSSKHDSSKAPANSSDLVTGISEGPGDSGRQQVEDDEREDEDEETTHKGNNNIHKHTGTNNLNEISSGTNYKTTMDTNSQGAIVAQMHACRLCDKLLSSSSSLDRHMLTHSGERPFVCKRCHMTFTTNGNMHRHMRTHLHKDTLAHQQLEQQIKSSLTGVISPKSSSPAPNPIVMAQSMQQQSPSLLSALSGCNIRDIIESTNKTSSNLAATATSSSNQLVASMPIIESLTGSSAMASNGANLIAPLISPVMANATQQQQQQQQSTVADSHAMTALLNQQLIAALSHPQPAAAQQLGQEIASRANPSKFAETESIKSHHKRTLTTNAPTAITTACSLQQPLRVSTTTTAEQQSSPSSCLSSSSLSSSPITSPHLSRRHQQQQSHHSHSAAAQLPSTTISANAQNQWPNQSQMADNNINSNNGQQPTVNTDQQQQQIYQSKDMLNSSYDPSAIVLNALQSATNGAQVDLESVKAVVLAAAAAAAAAAANATTNQQQPSSRSGPIETILGGGLKRASSREGDEDGEGDDEADDRCSNDETILRTNTSSSIDNESSYGRELRNKRRKQVNPRSTKQQVPSGPIKSLDSELAGNVDDSEAGDDSSSSILSSDSIKVGQVQTCNARCQNSGSTTTTSSSENRYIIEDISQSYVKTANPNAARKGGKRNRHCYKCKLCTYSSVDRCTLVRHLRIHSGERPYICGICRYAFTTKANCERHVRKRHKKQYNSLGGAGGVKGGNGGGRSLIITDHNNHQTIPVKVNPVAAQTISQTLQKIQEKQQDSEFDEEGPKGLTKSSTDEHFEPNQSRLPINTTSGYGEHNSRTRQQLSSNSKNSPIMANNNSSSRSSSKRKQNGQYRTAGAHNLNNSQMLSEQLTHSNNHQPTSLGIPQPRDDILRHDKEIIDEVFGSKKLLGTANQPQQLLPASAQTPTSVASLLFNHHMGPIANALEMLSSAKNLSQQLALNPESSFTNLLRQTPFNPIDLAAQALDLSCKFKTTK